MLNKSRSAVLQPGILSNAHQTGFPSALTCQPQKQRKREKSFHWWGLCECGVWTECFWGRNKLTLHCIKLLLGIDALKNVLIGILQWGEMRAALLCDAARKCCLVFSLWCSVVKCILTGKAQRRLAHGYVCWASDGFSHCISWAGNAVLSEVTHLHLLFLRQPKGSMGSWERVLEICFRCQDWFFVVLFWFRLLVFLLKFYLWMWLVPYQSTEVH